MLDLYTSEQSKHKINRHCDFTVSSYQAVTVYLQTHGSIKHHISHICSSVRLFFYILKLFWLTLYLQRHWKFAFDFMSKNMPVITSPLITRIMCTHTVYHKNWILVILHFWPYYISFTYYTLLLKLFFWYYIHKLFTYNFVKKLALFCINIVLKLPCNHARHAMI